MWEGSISMLVYHSANLYLSKKGLNSGWVTHICVGKLTIIGLDNGLSPGRRQVIIRNSAGILLIGHKGTNFREILIKFHTFSFKKIDLKMSSGKWRPSCLSLNVLSEHVYLWCNNTCYHPLFFNSLWPGDATWWQTFESVLIQVIAYCPAVPSYNQCWLVISLGLWHSPEVDFPGNAQNIYPWYFFSHLPT